MNEDWGFDEPQEYFWEDDLYQLNLREADDYRNEGAEDEDYDGEDWEETEWEAEDQFLDSQYESQYEVDFDF